MFDPKKPFTTRDGRKARLLADDLAGLQPIVAGIINADGSESALTYSREGRYFLNGSETCADLINTPEVGVVYVNYHGNGRCSLEFLSLDDANSAYSAKDRRGVQRITYADDKITSIELLPQDAP